MSTRRTRIFAPDLRRLFPPGHVAILRLYGPIAGGARTADWIELVRRLRESRRVPAVVLDIDSPGGSATASDDMFLALERLAAKKPLIAAIRGTGASGSYLAAMAARTDRHPAQRHRGLDRRHLGRVPVCRASSIAWASASPRTRAGRLKGMGAPWRDETDEERAKEQAIVDAFYAAFVGRVATGRRLTEEQVRELATGEVWLGETGAGARAGRRDRRPRASGRAGRRGRGRPASLGTRPAAAAA